VPIDIAASAVKARRRPFGITAHIRIDDARPPHASRR
jgi:hypothetical protein